MHMKFVQQQKNKYEIINDYTTLMSTKNYPIRALITTLKGCSLIVPFVLKKNNDNIILAI